MGACTSKSTSKSRNIQSKKVETSIGRKSQSVSRQRQEQNIQNPGTQKQSQKETDRTLPSQKSGREMETMSNVVIDHTKIHILEASEEQKLQDKPMVQVQSQSSQISKKQAGAGKADNKTDRINGGNLEGEKSEVIIKKPMADLPCFPCKEDAKCAKDAATTALPQKEKEFPGASTAPLAVGEGSAICAKDEASSCFSQCMSPRGYMRILRSKFNLIDENGDKLISREEFLTAWKTNPINDLDGWKVFKEMDTNNSGFVSFSEFSIWWLERAMSAMNADFQKMCVGTHRYITLRDFQVACETNFLCPLSEATEFFKKLDVNRDGKLSFKEFRDGTEQHYIMRTLQESSNIRALGKARSKTRKPSAQEKGKLDYKRSDQ